MAQLVKNLPSMQETWVRSLGREDPLAKGKAAHSSILVGRIPRTVQNSMGHKELEQLSNFDNCFGQHQAFSCLTFDSAVSVLFGEICLVNAIF